MSVPDLTAPPSTCILGIPLTAVAEAFPPWTFRRFLTWMDGQTMATCDGRTWNADAGRYEDSHCGPHGTVVFRWDVERFLSGEPVID